MLDLTAPLPSSSEVPGTPIINLELAGAVAPEASVQMTPKPTFTGVTVLPGRADDPTLAGIPEEVIRAVGIYDADCAGGCG